MKGRVGNLLNGNGITKSLIGYMTPYLLAQVSGFLSTLLGSNSAPPPASGQRRLQGKVPGTLLSGLGSSSLLEEGAIVLKERCVLLRVRPRVDPPVSSKVGILIALLV